jgi:hypothetical protein
MFDPKSHLIQLPRRVKDQQTGQWVTRLDEYLEVKWRVVMFREKYPHGSIIIEEICVDLDKGYARYKAQVGDGEGGVATGYGTETVKDFADFAERAETRAIGRALALLGFGTQFVGTDLTEGEHVADAPVAPPQTPTMDASMVPSTNGHLPPSATTTNPPRSSAAAENLRPSEPVTPHPLPEGEPSPPEPAEQRPTKEQVDALVLLAQTVSTKEDLSRRVRTLMGWNPNTSVTKRAMRLLTLEQYDRLMADFGAALRRHVEEDVPDFPPSSASDAKPLASSPTAGEDPDAEAKAQLRAEVATWALPVSTDEVEYILNHYAPEKARALLWGARKPKPAATPIEAAAD